MSWSCCFQPESGPREHTLQVQAAVGVLKVTKVLLAVEEDGPDEAGDADDHPAERGVVDAEGQAGAVAVEALVDDRERGRRGQERGRGRDGGGGLLGLLLQRRVAADGACVCSGCGDGAQRRGSCQHTMSVWQELL